jgi:hypothetical protein
VTRVADRSRPDAREAVDRPGWLARNPGCLITHTQLLECVWDLKDTKNNYVRVYLSVVCRKLEPDPGHPRHFLTERCSGVGRDSNEPPPLPTTAPSTTLAGSRSAGGCGSHSLPERGGAS